MLQMCLVFFVCVLVSFPVLAQTVEKVGGNNISVTTTVTQKRIATLNEIYEEKAVLTAQLERESAKIQERIAILDSIIAEAEKQGVTTTAAE